MTIRELRDRLDAEVADGNGAREVYLIIYFEDGHAGPSPLRRLSGGGLDHLNLVAEPQRRGVEAQSSGCPYCNGGVQDTPHAIGCPRGRRSHSTYRAGS